MANDNCYSHNGAPKYKRRVVSAIRDFPPGCGRFAPRITVEPTKNSVYIASSPNKGTAAEAVDTSWGGHVDSRVGDSTAILTQTSVVESCLKTLGQVADVVDGVSSVNEKQPTGMSLGALELTGIVEPGKASESELFKRDGGVAAAPQDKDTTESSYACFCSGNTSLTICSTRKCLEKSKARSYPPRRRVSAIRDFPPDCGRNAPLCDKEACSIVAAPLKETKVSEESPLKDQKTLRQTEVTGTNLIKEILRDQDSQECKSLNEVTEATKAEVWAEHEENSVGSRREQDKLGTISEMNIEPEDANDGWGGSPRGSNQDLFVCQSEAFLDKSISDIEISGGKWAKKMVAYKKGESLKRKHADVSGNRTSEDNAGSSEVSSERVLVQGLMAAPFCPWQQSKEESKLSSPNNITARIWKEKDPVGPEKSKLKPKKNDPVGPEKSKLTSKVKLIEGKTSVGKTPLKSQPFREEYAHESTSELVAWENQDVVDTDEHHEDLQVTLHPRAFTVNPPPFGHGLSESKSNADVIRNKVRKTLRLFQAVCRKLLQEEEAKTKGESKHKRIDLQASKMLKDQKRFVNTGKQILGPVPGVEVGDEFQYRVELNIIGLHRQIQGGIDYVNRGGKVLATSIVSSGSYCDDLDNSDFVIYTGSGGNVIGKDKEPEDQRLVKGNLALSNSISERNPVRVIRGLKETRSSDFSDAKYRTVFTYTYDGLYVVEKCWQEPGPHGKLVFKFRLNRIPGQPELAWKVVKKSEKSEAREGLCVHDISQGKESVAIGVVNTIDDERPLPFKYITRMIYPGWLRPMPSRGCDCSRGCSDTEKCICSVKNEGEIPYNHNGAIVEAKPLVYECGPCCKCPSSCHNRVTQHGLKFQLEVFKTELRGWGVRSLNSIPSGNFICEYIGELLEDKEAEERTGNDEYLFDIGNNYDDSNLWDGLSTLMPDVHVDSREVVEEAGFTIDAAMYGNVGRFINHSCSPNLYAQNVLYDHEDKRVPHIMFFAAENIPPLQELTYHYNYTVGQVRDSNGNIKKKDCYCGSSECVGRMY
ncbi:histone-lysine N-methyltransferase, H3 lysine-9 specific SUVH6-like [Rhodamnia argentea]|uniref:Histone-lysine N-methyltransferase, H3 lysine-9 specific SUVH6-like n=1 Tax=Rhodamnia argentea TaxID=178133 RepID=A0A8B8PHQ2_9MYRT|nr:histone-lysine N-methyltransferase, H3 lysine-9 specific SUVH6-like [Rhodamnia argentea]XP_048131938.1 histone-lysine N-methyltransferase, H3 lysine-9 specific SUVH6-like [Rhodamnia argentea]XP_048131939.1 histone-lysine N-methyltransferase, H3 lysine-9 specific SUVH6-like [Rhodamnia argentea]XP_048131940.1 histone-lysine N-methyltransferase, H3 lysine-9 specific SUVH6-like [Rhodamnia argentea]XP_048131941.1 histone-lysine N-methyltransferase, H3 lysine-9 specific SUVH6-like [Rhodamnia argen